MTRRRSLRGLGAAPPWLAVVSAVAIATLAWTSYRATAAWRGSAAQLAERRAESSVNLLVTALTRDMRAVQTLVLAPAAGAAPTVVAERVASAFARYPYPEAFFLWRRESAAGGVTLFTRTDRPPAWQPRAAEPGYESLRVETNADLGADLLARVRREAPPSADTAFFDLTRAGRQYQAVAQLVYADARGDAPQAIFGFLVDLRWARDHYFAEIAEQTRGIGGLDADTGVRILDAAGRAVVGPPPDARPAVRRTFPFLFFDPVLAATGSGSTVARETWSAEAIIGGDPVLTAANRGAGQVALVAGLAALALTAGFVLTLRAARANADLARMRADFMVAVTHELKTPIASMRALTETLASGRASDPAMVREYGRLAAHDATRLGRLIENLLAHARITDVTEAYAFEAIGADVLIDDTLGDFATQLEHGGFDVDVHIAEKLPPARADRVAMRLALGNLVDNAIRYSGAGRLVRVHARAGEGTVVIEVSDQGVGIPADELQQVWTKFFRGRTATPGGSGLGLAITQQIVTDHGGTLAIESQPGSGTTVRVTLPASQENQA